MRCVKPKKIRVGILFGGKSTEHEVSLQSAKNVVAAMDKDKYEIVLLGVDKKGGWHLSNGTQAAFDPNKARPLQLNENAASVALVPSGGQNQLIGVSGKVDIGAIDVVFPVLHGTFGEDGTVQGMLKLANVPFVGAGVLGSAIGMDKDIMKRLLRDAQIPVARFVVVKKGEKSRYEDVVRRVGAPFFVKPANAGSSVGVHKVKSRKQFEVALKDAFSYDHKVLVEEYIKGRELECSVLGNEDPLVSLPGEVLPTHEFYSYEAKYLDEHGARLEIPAKVSPRMVKKIQRLAVEAFRALCCEGMARVDFFLRDDGKLFVNEINTIPGFTKISMYPKLWEASGISYSKLVDTLIELAVERFKKEKKLKTSYEP